MAKKQVASPDDSPQTPLDMATFRSVFEALPGLYLLLSPTLTIVGASDAYLLATMTRREDIMGHPLFEVFPDNPADTTASGQRNLTASLEKVLATKAPDKMAMQKYDIRRPTSSGGGFEVRYWSPVNTPVLGSDQTVSCIIHAVEDVTELVFLKTQKDESESVTTELRARSEQMEAAITREQSRFAASEEKFRLLIDSVIDYAIFMLDENGHVVTWNSGAERTKGYLADEIIGQHFSAFYTHEDVKEGVPQKALEEASKHGRSEMEGWRIRKDGTQFWANVVINALRDSDGRLRGFAKITRNMTSKRQLEAYERQLFEEEATRKAAEAHVEQLWRQKEQLRVTLESIGDGVIATDTLGQITLLNSVAQALTGWTAVEAMGRRLEEVFQIIAEDTRQVVENPVARAFREGTVVGLANHTLLIARDGFERPIADSAAPIRDVRGEIIGMVLVFRDYTQQRDDQKTLLMRDRAIRAVTQGILITDVNQPDHPIIYASPGFEQITGYSSAETIGKNCRFLQGKDTDIVAKQQVREAIRNHRPCKVEILNYRKDGTPFWNSVSISPIYDDFDTVTHFVGIQEDVTDLRSLAEQLRQTQKMEAIGKLAGGIAHDFNNVLAIVLGYTEILQEEPALSADGKELVNEIQTAAKRAANLTSQLLAFSRQQLLTPTVVNLNTVIADLERMLVRLVGEDILLATRLALELWLCKVDIGQFHQVLMNLVVNSRDAMPRGGKVTIETYNAELDADYAESHLEVQPGPYVVVAISDTGTGIEPAVKARMFEPFFTTKAMNKGTGLGLSMVFGIVKQSGGHIAVYSEVGQGSTFRIYFPATFSPSQLSAEMHDATPSGGVETILVVEDEQPVRKLISRILRTHGYTVLEADGGREAAQIAERCLESVDLLLTDVVMPEMSGRELSEKLRALHPGLQVLFMSGYTDDAIVRHGIIEAESYFIQKPFTAVALARKVREIFD